MEEKTADCTAGLAKHHQSINHKWWPWQLME